jgi:HlyD family secretion protein
VRTQESRIQQERAGLERSRYELGKVRIESPIDGVVTRRNIEEGETVVVGTMNNPGTVLLTIADMSVIEAEVEVDETDIPSVRIGQTAKVAIDAIPDRTFTGRVTEIGNSPIQQTTAGAAQIGQRQATNFKVVVTLGEPVAGVRPGFTCTADITTARRAGAVSVPIQALTVREVTVDAAGRLVREPPRDRGRRGVEPRVTASELQPGQSRKELEGVFLVRDGRAVFAPVRIGIAGERYFEVLEGLRPGDRVITGPFTSVRELVDGDPVRVEDTARGGARTAD